MTVQLLPTLPPKLRGVQITEQPDGKYSVYTDTGQGAKLEEEVLLGKDLDEQGAFDMVESFTPTTEKSKRNAAPQRKIVSEEEVSA